MYNIILIVAVTGIAAALGFYILELTKWHNGQSFISRYHKWVRTVLFVLAELLMGLILYGGLAAGRMDTASEGFYWGGCTLVGVAVMIVAWLDLREAIKDTKRMVKSAFGQGNDDRK